MIGVLPPEWTEKPLSEVAEVIQGQSPPGNTYNTSGVGLPFFQGKAEFGELFPEARKWCTDPRKIAEQGDVLLSIRAPVGPTNLARERCCIGRGLAAIRPRPGISTKYLLHYLRSVESELAKKATGTTFGAIGGAVLRSQLVRVAPPEEQQAIVDALDSYFSRLDEVEAGLERVQRNLKRYRASVLQAAVTGRLVPTEAELARAEGREYEPASELLKRILVERRKKWEESGRRGKYEEPAPPDTSNLPQLPEGWCWATGDQLFSMVTSGSRGWAKYYAQSGALFLRIGNLDHGSIFLDLRSVQRVMPPKGAEGERTRVEASDILISITADIGMVGFVVEGLGEAFINQHIALARPASAVTGAFIAWALASPQGLRSLQSLQRGATKTGLGLDDIRAVTLPIPPLAEQQRMVEHIESHLSITANLSSVNSSVASRVSRLRQSILSTAFEGKLVHSAVIRGRTQNETAAGGLASHG